MADKTMERTKEKAWNELQSSLKRLGTEKIDLYQFHVVENIPFVTPYLPIGLGDNIVKLLAWTGVFIVGILIIVINLLDSLAT